MVWLNSSVLSELAVILFGAFGLGVTLMARDVERWPQRLCIAILSASVGSGLFALLELAAAEYRVPLPLYAAAHFAVVLAAPVPPLLMVAYFLFRCGEDWRRSPVMYIHATLTTVLVILVIAVELIGRSITPYYEIHDRSWGLLYLLLAAAIETVDLIALFRRRKKLSRTQTLLFLACFLTLAFIQVILLQLMLVTDFLNSYQTQKEEAERQRLRAAVAQMQPHFIYNTMMTIYSLCAQDPEKARQVTLDFSRYLRENFMAIAEECPVPFTKELEHIRAYLAVEQARYEGQLFVEFDTPVTFFRLPPLTLQPIVENAVKHGLDPELEPLYISVTTEETDRGVRITVEDTGPGYAPTDDSGPHIALDNIRQRLKTMCGGTLEIAPREAGGTRVTMFIPRPKE